MLVSSLLLAWLSYTVCAAPLTSREDAQRVAGDLGHILSANSTILVPTDAGWQSILDRAAYPRVSPGYQVAVEVGAEEDVAKTVSYANRNNISFLAVAGGHGETVTLNRLQSGIQINLRKLNFAYVNYDGTGTIGGGSLQWETTSQLYAQEKQAVTGLCECVSTIGPLLGGGHSLLQSLRGFSLDTLISAKVVLADGRTVEASKTKNPDLFWGLRGAGHNFGIVTSFKINLFDVPKEGYSMYRFIYSSDQLEPLFNLVNTIESKAYRRDPKLFINGVISRVPAVSDKPLFNYTVIYQGTKAELDAQAKPFLDLGPKSATPTVGIPYDQVSNAFGSGKSSPQCRENTNAALMGVSLPKYDIDGMRAAVSIFGKLTSDPRFAYSFVLLEDYGIDKVRSIPVDSTALAPEERTNPILASPVVTYRGNDPQTKKDAQDYMLQIKDAMYQGVDANKGKFKRHAYVNYASGLESVEEIYGYGKDRLKRLRDLKKKWDPQNQFRFYNPLV